MKLKHFSSRKIGVLGAVFIIVFIVLIFGRLAFQIADMRRERLDLESLLSQQNEKIASLSARIRELENEDLRKTNEAIKATVSAVNNTFSSYTALLEKVSDAKLQKIDVTKQETELPKIVKLLSDLQWQEAETKITEVKQAVDKTVTANQTKIAASASVASESQVLPTSDGFSRQTVKTDRGSFVVTLISADLSSTKILTDTASENDCVDVTCPTLPLVDYVSRNGGFAGINGSYFCPPDYARCADKIGSFDTLAFNSRLKKYINSDNNKFSTVSMFVQTSDHGMRFMGQTVEWGRDTGITGGLANYPLLVSGGNAATSDTGGAGGRNFIGVKSGKVYIGHVHGANFATAAVVLATLGMENALNLDTGGSTAIYYNGKYVMGPGRLLPNAIILAR